MKQFIGLDIHRKFIQACVMDKEGQVELERRLYLEDCEDVFEFFGGFDRCETEVAMEATVGWMWLADVLDGLGIRVHLAHMMGVRVIAQSRCKTDKIDARTLAQLLRTGYLPEAYLAARDVRDRRMTLRHRQGLIGWRTSAKNRVHALLARHNIHLPGSDIFGAQGRRALAGLQLPRQSGRILADLLEAIEFFTAQIRAVEKRLYGQLGEDRRVDLLRSMPGIGKLTAHYVLAEIGEIERFARPEKLVSYCGLCPSTRQSASVVRHGGVRGAGRSVLKWALVEAAHTAARRDSYFAAVFHRIANRRGRGKAYVAVARKMARVIWQMLTEERAYETRVKTVRAGSSRRVTAGA